VGNSEKIKVLEEWGVWWSKEWFQNIMSSKIIWDFQEKKIWEVPRWYEVPRQELQFQEMVWFYENDHGSK
jgi:hypothetical protein